MTRSGHDARRPPEATIPSGGSAPARQSRASDIEARAAARLIALTANPNPLLSKESALHHGPVSTAYLTSLRGLPATLERLRIDCQLTEAMPPGSTRCTWPRSSASASTPRSATRSMPGN